MSIELRPLGVACNLACHYCYQNPQRDAGNQRMNYDLDKMKAEALRIGGSFTLFGGEPLLMRFEDLEDLFAWGLEKHGGSAIQTNAVLIEDRHIDLFRRCKVSVGISIDGPGALNDARWHRGLEKTRQSTAIVERVIERLCREFEPPGLIITLHRGNATAEKLPIMADWVRKLHSLGIRNVRLHLLEVDHASVRDSLGLSARENVEALLAFAEVQSSLPGMYFDLFDEMEALLDGRRRNAMTEFDRVVESVDWARMAEPQADGYDTDITLRLAENGVTPLRPIPYRRRPISGQITFCDGAVAVRQAPECGMMSDDLLPAPVDHPNIAAGRAHLSRWPNAYAQFTRLIDTVYPYTDPEQARMGDQALGSSSHSYEEDFGSVHATVDNALGFAQALIHEMSHQKLRALGVSIETSERLITNSPSEQFESPIRKDRKRPMSAVFHAQYSFIHVTALDLEMLAKANGQRERQHILMLLARNVTRMQAGYEEVATHVKTDEAGRQFVGAFMRWSRNVLDRGQAELDANGYGAQ